MQRGKTYWVGALGVVLLASAHAVNAQDAKQIVQQAVNTQLAADRNDHTHWRYIRTDDDKDKVVVVETENGAISRHIEVNGRPASAAVLAADDEYIQKFIHDPSMQAEAEAERGARRQERDRAAEPDAAGFCVEGGEPDGGYDYAVVPARPEL